MFFFLILDHIQALLWSEVCCRPRKFVSLKNVVRKVDVKGPGDSKGNIGK